MLALKDRGQARGREEKEEDAHKREGGTEVAGGGGGAEGVEVFKTRQT